MKNGVLIGQKIEFISIKRCAVRCGVILSDFCVLAGYIAVLKGGPVGNDWLPFSQNTSPSPSPDSQPWLCHPSMWQSVKDGIPRVTRRRTTDGQQPPPDDFDKGWSNLRGRKSTAGFVSTLLLTSHPAPFLHRLSLTCLRCLALLVIRRHGFGSTFGRNAIVSEEAKSERALHR